MFAETYPEPTKARKRICLGPVGPGQDGPQKLNFSRCRDVWAGWCFDGKRGVFERSGL